MQALRVVANVRGQPARRGDNAASDILPAIEIDQRAAKRPDGREKRNQEFRLFGSALMAALKCHCRAEISVGNLSHD
jgi:hypothetical protein